MFISPITLFIDLNSDLTQCAHNLEIYLRAQIKTCFMFITSTVERASSVTEQCRERDRGAEA